MAGAALGKDMGASVGEAIGEAIGEAMSVTTAGAGMAEARVPLLPS